MTATIIDFMKKKNENDISDNHEAIVRLVHQASHAARASKQWPAGKENWLKHCRDNLEKALVYLNEEIDGPHDDES